VVENMSFLACPHCAEEGREHRLEIFGSGGGARVAETLTRRFGYDVPLLAEVPIDLALREGGDSGTPVIAADPTSPSAKALAQVAKTLAGRGRGLAGMQLGIMPTAKV
jgi:ATP-binding protein involved in chromosome partitioning